MQRLKRSGEIFLVPFLFIAVNEEVNRRIDYGDIETLALSIKENGLSKPITVQKVRGEDQYELRDGFRRMRAINLLISQGEDFPLVKAVLTSKGYNEDDTLFEQIISNDGKPLTKLEEGSVYKALINREFTETEIARRVGKSNTHIRNSLALVSVPKSIQNKIAEGKITENTVVAIVDTVGDDEAKITAAVDEAIENADGKKARPRNVTSVNLKSKPPIKRMEELKSLLEDQKIDNPTSQFFLKFYNRLKAKSTSEELLELFVERFT